MRKFKLKEKSVDKLINNVIVYNRKTNPSQKNIGKFKIKNGKITRKQAEETYRRNWEIQKELIRRKVLDEGRLDILAHYVLGYIVAPHHLIMANFIQRPGKDRALILGPRGSGKTHICTYVPIVYEVLKNPNIRILITSNTQKQAEAFLRVIKDHLENPLLVEIFGIQRGDKWDTTEINVINRTVVSKESTVTCIGLSGGMTSKHFDKIWVEDLVDEESSRTQKQRDYADTWFYKTLYNAKEDWTSFIIVGTLYHWDDLYCRLVKQGKEFEHDLLRIPALTQSDEAVTENNPEGYISYWPDRKPVEVLLNLKKFLGIHWYTQQMNIVDMEIGEYFQPEWFKVGKPQPDMRKFQGVDLSVGRTKTSAKFAHATIAVSATKPRIYYLVDAYNGRLTSAKQNNMMINKYNEYDPLRLGIEGNAYQGIKEQDLKEIDDEMRIKLIFTQKDKLTNALKFQPIVEGGRFYIPEHLEWVKDLFVTFPNVESLDMFDAIYIAYLTSRKGIRKVRKKEPGVL